MTAGMRKFCYSYPVRLLVILCAVVAVAVILSVKTIGRILLPQRT